MDVINYVKSCNVCNVNKKANVKAKRPLGQFIAGLPLEKIRVDFVGLLQKSRQDNRCIPVIVDKFTKWIEIVPLPNQSAHSVAKATLDNFISRMDYSIQIHTDQGTNFDSNMFEDICNTFLEIIKTRTTPYRPCSNGQVERYKRTILQAVRCYFIGKQSDWDANLQQFAALCAPQKKTNWVYSQYDDVRQGGVSAN